MTWVLTGTHSSRKNTYENIDPKATPIGERLDESPGHKHMDPVFNVEEP